MRRVLLTGATGFIGYHLLKELIKNKVEVWAVCRENCKEKNSLEKITGVHVIECEFDNLFLLAEKCKDFNFDVFYHLAWDGATGDKRCDAVLQLKNIEWTLACVELAQKLKCEKIIIAGTVIEKQAESIMLNKLYLKSAFYIQAKASAHMMIDSLGKKINQPIVWMNFYHPIGIWNKKEQIIANTMVNLINETECQFGDGLELFDVIDVRDLARAFYIAGEKHLKKSTYYIGSGVEPKRTLKSYLVETRDIVAPHINLKIGALKFEKLPMKSEWLDMDDFVYETGFNVKYDFSDSVNDMKDWLLHEREYYERKWKEIQWGE